MTGSLPQAGPTNSLTDVDGLRIGHHARVGDGWLTGTTVVTAGPGGMVAGIDVRGGGPGTHETDLLHPSAAAERVHALVLTGGSAFGTAACLGVMHELADRGIGFPVGPAGVVPLVPGVVLFDLGRGGDPRARPDAGFGRLALLDALGEADLGEAVLGEDAVGAGAFAGTSAEPASGSRRGAGTGAVAGGLKGGLAQASVVLPAVPGPAGERAAPVTVAAVAAVNAFGSPVDPRTGMLWGARAVLPADLPTDLADGLDGLTRPLDPAAVQALRRVVSSVARGRLPVDLPVDAGGAGPGRHTTLVVVATDATLTKAQCTKLAGVAQGGMARAVNPVHTTFDGDAVFGASTGSGPAPDPLGLNEIYTAGADVVSRAITRAVLQAVPTSTPAGRWSTWRELAGR